MTRVVNSFALLGDEEGDDLTVLVENFAKKVDSTASDPTAAEKNQPTPNQAKNQHGNGKTAKFLLSESGNETADRGRGIGGQGRGSGRVGFHGNRAEHFSNEQGPNYGDGNGNRYDSGYRGRGRGGIRGRGRGKGFNKENVVRDEKEGSGGNRQDVDDGWEQVPHARARGYYGNDVNNNRDEERPFRNGNRNYGGGERRSYGGGNRGFGGKRDGMNYGRGELLNNDEVKEKVNDADNNDDVKGVSNNPIAEGDAAVAAVAEDSKDVVEEKALEESVKVDNSAKKDREEEEKLMTLEEYEKLLAEKRKALEALRNEERKVTADKDFEAMQLVEKKKDETVPKPETTKLKKKDSLDKDEKARKTVSINEFLKPADGKFFYHRGGRGRGREFGNGNRADHGGIKNEEHGFGNTGYPRGGGRARDGPVIHIEDQGQFPVLKGSAPAVEAA